MGRRRTWHVPVQRPDGWSDCIVFDSPPTIHGLRVPSCWGFPFFQHLSIVPGVDAQAGYRLEATVGSGGQGTVFRARRESLPFAVKFIPLSRAPWARRELDVGVKLWRSAGLPLVGHGLWPALKPRFLFLVTPYVRGLPLDVWAQVHNPHALQVADLVRQAARLLGEVHAAGVVHRDVKGPNLLVHGEGQLVLVDFGVATYEGGADGDGAVSLRHLALPQSPGVALLAW
jgi:serine/threonine protein kinase